MSKFLPTGGCKWIDLKGLESNKYSKIVQELEPQKMGIWLRVVTKKHDIDFQ